MMSSANNQSKAWEDNEVVYKINSFTFDFY